MKRQGALLVKGGVTGEFQLAFYRRGRHGSLCKDEFDRKNITERMGEMGKRLHISVRQFLCAGAGASTGVVGTAADMVAIECLQLYSARYLSEWAVW